MFLAHLSRNSESVSVSSSAPAIADDVKTVSHPENPKGWTEIEADDVPELVPAPVSSAVIVAPSIRVSSISIPAQSAVTISSIDELKPIRGTSRAGQFVHDTQIMDKDFRNVSTGWTSRLADKSDLSVMSYDDAIDYLDGQRGAPEDIVAEYTRFRAIAGESGLLLCDQKTGRQYSLTDSALDKFADITGIGSTLPRRLSVGDEVDRTTLAIVAQNGLRKLGEKRGLIRTRNDGTIRAFLSEKYTIVDNRWLIETMRRLIPGGLVSHFRSDDECDSVFFNILIPDSIRKETDSEYGGMLSCGNGETGHNRLHTMPSVFRAICMNGCIWGAEEGIGFVDQVHRGSIDLGALAESIKINLERQIPLLNSGVDRMLATRSIVIDSAPLPAIGAVLQSLSIPGITRAAADVIVSAYAGQRTEFSRVSAFDIVQGMTRAAREMSAELQETIERAAGTAVYWPIDRWETVFRASSTIRENELKRLFATSV